MIIQVFSNSMIFPCMEFFSDFPGFPWFPEPVGTLLEIEDKNTRYGPYQLKRYSFNFKTYYFL